jgi:hypothetical protein
VFVCQSILILGSDRLLNVTASVTTGRIPDKPGHVTRTARIGNLAGDHS